jgi:hypothetical protein
VTPRIATDNAQMGNELLIRRSRVRNPPGSLSYATAPAQGAGESVGEAPSNAPTKSVGARRGAERCRLCGVPETVRMIAGHPLCAFCLERIAEIAAEAEQKVAGVLT